MNVDIYGVKNVEDIGDGLPLFKDFTTEDWVIMQLRSEMYLLIKGFLKDVDDEDRTGLPEKHFDFYYAKYFTKKIVPKQFGMETLQDVMNLAKDVLQSNGEDTPILELQLNDDIETLDIFCKLCEDGRRERQRRIDAGDETAMLKFQPSCMTQKTVAVVTPGPQKAGGIRPAIASGSGWKQGKAPVWNRPW